jgi:hypothetical protein
MRTRLILRDDLLEAAKKVAAGRKTSLSTVINESLSMRFNSTLSAPALPIPLPTYEPKNAVKVDLNPKELSDIGL